MEKLFNKTSSDQIMLEDPIFRKMFFEIKQDHYTEDEVLEAISKIRGRAIKVRSLRDYTSPCRTHIEVRKQFAGRWFYHKVNTRLWLETY